MPYATSAAFIYFFAADARMRRERTMRDYC